MARRLRSGNRIPGWLLLTLASTLVGVAVLPFGNRGVAAARPGAVQAGLIRLRCAIRNYANDHADWPGQFGDRQLRAQLLGMTDAAGRVGQDAEHVFGPYLQGDIPANPAGGGTSIMVVEQMPEQPTDEAAWIYSHETGEIRPDTTGTSADGRPLFDL